jgi:hypothetical protein
VRVRRVRRARRVRGARRMRRMRRVRSEESIRVREETKEDTNLLLFSGGRKNLTILQLQPSHCFVGYLSKYWVGERKIWKTFNSYLLLYLSTIHYSSPSLFFSL